MSTANLTALTGTEEQIAYAEKIRTHVFAELDRIIAEGNNIPVCENAQQVLSAWTDAALWIAANKPAADLALRFRRQGNDWKPQGWQK